MADFKALPDETTTKEASDLEVFDINGDKVKFGSIFASEKTIVVFIRHFFCGVRYEILCPFFDILDAISINVRPRKIGLPGLCGTSSRSTGGGIERSRD